MTLSVPRAGPCDQGFSHSVWEGVFFLHESHFYPCDSYKLALQKVRGEKSILGILYLFPFLNGKVN